MTAVKRSLEIKVMTGNEAWQLASRSTSTASNQLRPGAMFNIQSFVQPCILSFIQVVKNKSPPHGACRTNIVPLVHFSIQQLLCMHQTFRVSHDHFLALQT
jgi:hypothetical protein